MKETNCNACQEAFIEKYASEEAASAVENMNFREAGGKKAAVRPTPLKDLFALHNQRITSTCVHYQKTSNNKSLNIMFCIVAKKCIPSVYIFLR